MHLHIIDRNTARKVGLKHFFTGRPCAKGHLVLRYTKTGECLSCHAARLIAWREKNKDRIDEYNAKYQEENRQYFRNWNKTSPKADACRKRRKAATENGTLRIEDPVFVMRNKYRIKHLRQLAKQYEEWTGIKFEVDHIVPIIDEKVCGLHWHGNLQLIPMRLNRRKRGVITHDLAA